MIFSAFLNKFKQQTCRSFNALSGILSVWRCLLHHKNASLLCRMAPTLLFTSNKRSVTNVKMMWLFIWTPCTKLTHIFVCFIVAGQFLEKLNNWLIYGRFNSLKVYCGQLMKCWILKLQLRKKVSIPPVHVLLLCHGGGVYVSQCYVGVTSAVCRYPPLVCWW